jgi:hypothetical protein
MSKLHILSQSVVQMIPSDGVFTENYLQQTIEQKNVTARRQTIHEDISDADAGKLISLATVKAKWLSR